MRRFVLIVSLAATCLSVMAVNAAAAGETWNPASADFGQVAVGTTSAPQSFTLTAGSSSYEADPEIFSSEEFRVTSRGNCGGTLLPGQSCSGVTVVFAPTSTGSKSATLRGGFSASPQAALTGVGVPPSATKPKKKCKKGKKGKKSAVAAKKKCKKK